MSNVRRLFAETNQAPGLSVETNLNGTMTITEVVKQILVLAMQGYGEMALRMMLEIEAANPGTELAIPDSLQSLVAADPAVMRSMTATFERLVRVLDNG